MPRKRTSIKKVEAPNKFEWLKKNIVIVPVIAATTGHPKSNQPPRHRL